MNMKPETFVLQITSCLCLLETSSEFRLDLGEFVDLETIFQVFQLDEVPDDILDQLLPLAVACLYVNAQNCEDFRYPGPSDMPSPQEDKHVAEIAAFTNRLYASESWCFVRSYMPIQDSMLHYNIDDAIIRRAIPFLELAYHAINIKSRIPVLSAKTASKTTKNCEVLCASESQHRQDVQAISANKKKYRIPVLSAKTASKTTKNYEVLCTTSLQYGVQKMKKQVATLGAKNYDVETKVPHLTSKDKRAAISTERLSFFDNKKLHTKDSFN
ncbi:unnamed protein product [Aphanomyces euteiches]